MVESCPEEAILETHCMWGRPKATHWITRLGAWLLRGHPCERLQRGIDEAWASRYLGRNTSHRCDFASLSQLSFHTLFIKQNTLSVSKLVVVCHSVPKLPKCGSRSLNLWSCIILVPKTRNMHIFTSCIRLLPSLIFSHERSSPIYMCAHLTRHHASHANIHGASRATWSIYYEGPCFNAHTQVQRGIDGERFLNLSQFFVFQFFKGPIIVYTIIHP